MESASLARSKCVKALSGTALLMAELEFVFADEFDPVDPPDGDSAFVIGASTPELGVYSTDVVVAFEPADDDPDDENEGDAPGPEVPADAFA